MEAALAEVKPVAHWSYENASGEVVGYALRINRPDGKKIFTPLRLCSVGWEEKAMEAPRPLYALMTFTHAPADENIYIVEGEKCCDALDGFGLFYTTSVSGSKAANKSDWTTLKGRNVVILPDHDEPGDKYAADVARLALAAGAKSIRIVRLSDAWPDMPKGGDLCDMLGAEGPWGSLDDADVRAAIQGLAEQAEPIEATQCDELGAVIVNLADVQPEPVQWLWPGRFALGKLTILVGDPGLGKSMMTLDMAARVTTGRPWPDAPYEKNTAGGVVLLSAEDDAGDTIRPRLDAAGADVSRVNLIRTVRLRPTFVPGREGPPELVESMFNLARDLAALESAIEQTPDCRLVVIDPITAYLGGTDSHKNADIRGLLAPLSQLASRHKVAIVVVSHLNKNAGGRAIYRTMGSLAFNAAARAVWAVAKDANDPSRRLVLPVKNNLAGDVLGMAYAIESAGRGEAGAVVWEPDPIEVDIDDALRRDANETSDTDDAADWLRNALADGELPAAEALKQGRDNGFTDKAIRKAFKSIGGKHRREGFGKGGKWVWSMPDDPNEKTEIVRSVASSLGDGSIDSIDAPS